MNAKLIRCAAALLASAGCALATAQEPVASAWTNAGAAAENVNAAVQALNADASLQNSKITVQPDGDNLQNLLLTGVSPTLEQAQKAGEIAKSAAGGAIVVNAIRPERTKYETPAYELEQAPVEPAKQ